MDQLLIVYRKGSLKNKTLFCGKKDLFVERDLFYGRHSEFKFSCRSKQIKFFQQKKLIKRYLCILLSLGNTHLS